MAHNYNTRSTPARQADLAHGSESESGSGASLPGLPADLPVLQSAAPTDSTAEFPDKVRHQKVILLRTQNQMAKKSVDSIVNQITEQSQRIVQLKANNGHALMIKEYARQLMDLFNAGNKALVEYEACSTRLISVTSYLHLLHEFADAAQAEEAKKIRDAAAGEWEPYSGILTRLYHEKADLLFCLLEDQASCSSAASSRHSSVERPKHRVDFSYLKPETLSIECNSKEITKFKDDFTI